MRRLADMEPVVMNKLVFLFIAIFLSAPVSAESDMDVALEIVSLSKAGTDVDKLATTLKIAFGAETEAQTTAIATEVLRIINSEQYRRDVASIYLEMFNSAELREFRELMKSPSWQKWIKNKHFWLQQVALAMNNHITENQSQFIAAIENAREKRAPK